MRESHRSRVYIHPLHYLRVFALFNKNRCVLLASQALLCEELEYELLVNIL